MKTIFRTTALVLIACIATLAGAPAAFAAEGKVNVNEASIEQLQLLPRIGPAVAQRIVDHREESGKFKQAADLMLVRGIGEKTFELLEPYVSVEGKTTLTEKVRTPRPSEEDGES